MTLLVNTVATHEILNLPSFLCNFTSFVLLTASSPTSDLVFLVVYLDIQGPPWSATLSPSEQRLQLSLWHGPTGPRARGWPGDQWRELEGGSLSWSLGSSDRPLFVAGHRDTLPSQPVA